MMLDLVLRRFHKGDTAGEFQNERRAEGHMEKDFRNRTDGIRPLFGCRA